MPPNRDPVDGLESGLLLVLEKALELHALMLLVLFQALLVLLNEVILRYSHSGRLHRGAVDPLVESAEMMSPQSGSCLGGRWVVVQLVGP